MRKRDRLKTMACSKRVQRIALCAFMLPLYTYTAQAAGIAEIQTATKVGRIIKRSLAVAGTRPFICTVTLFSCWWADNMSCCRRSSYEVCWELVLIYI